MRNVKFTFDNVSYRVTEMTEEYDLVANPIYNISMKCTASNPQQETITSTTTTARGDEAVMYEEVINLDGSKARCSKHDSTTQVITNTKGYAQCHNI